MIIKCQHCGKNIERSIYIKKATCLDCKLERRKKYAEMCKKKPSVDYKSYFNKK